MDLNFEEFRGDFFSIDGHKVETFEECKDWIAFKFQHRGWEGLLRQTNDDAIIKEYENLALDLYSFLLGNGQIK